MNNYLLAVVDVTERLHIVDIRNHSVLDSVDLSFVGLTYQSSFYKGLATTRAVSQAMVKKMVSLQQPNPLYVSPVFPIMLLILIFPGFGRRLLLFTVRRHLSGPDGVLGDKRSLCRIASYVV